jgi:hypothetical protein
MHITPAIAQPDPLNRPKAESAPLKPLAAGDFLGQLRSAQSGEDDSAADHPAAAPRLRPLTLLNMTPGVKGPVKPLEPLNPPTPPLLPLGEAGFRLGNPRPPKSEDDRVQEQARKWVSQTFYGTMLKQMRDSPFKNEMFSGGRGGQAFTPMLDQHLADRMSRSADSGLVRQIARKLQARGAPAPQSPPTPTPANPQPVRPHVAPSLRA